MAYFTNRPGTIHRTNPAISWSPRREGLEKYRLSLPSRLQIYGQNGIPVISLQSESRTIISGIVGVNDSQVIFRSNEKLDQWEARADGTGTVGVGLLVGSGSAVNENQNVSFDILNTELTNGDKTYPIDVFAHNTAGWSSRL